MHRTQNGTVTKGDGPKCHGVEVEETWVQKRVKARVANDCCRRRQQIKPSGHSSDGMSQAPPRIIPSASLHVLHDLCVVT